MDYSTFDVQEMVDAFNRGFCKFQEGGPPVRPVEYADPEEFHTTCEVISQEMRIPPNAPDEQVDEFVRLYAARMAFRAGLTLAFVDDTVHYAELPIRLSWLGIPSPVPLRLRVLRDRIVVDFAVRKGIIEKAKKGRFFLDPAAA